ncbi:putative natural resistance-associated macrophage protein [Lyophyllum shimeji]|uniref:Natural resistance-associated macrophage protein n=1 Tax=Lyophyllum shimeji TaxID=47721 RepID=A0A9P3PHX8_LYOSH|nr:putative natural resistance-associated macrophage protein [Lyophyllum shimeji]
MHQSHPGATSPPRPSLLKAQVLIVTAGRTPANHVRKHAGVGIVCAVAYFDPGNWSVDFQAGSNFGYRPMLFVLLVASLGAMVLQTLACKLGCVTGLDLASHCRLLLHDRPKHTRLIRHMVLYPLYVLAEIAIISTDLAELLGSAIGLCLIFPKLPLWAGVLLTATDVLIFLLFADPSRGQGRPVRVFEFVIIFLVLAVLACFIVLLVKVNPHWPDVFLGYLPSKKLFQSEPDAVYSAVGILGATVMPHALFLGSSLAAQDRVSLAPPEAPSLPGPAAPHTLLSRFREVFAPLFRVTRAERVAAAKDYRTRYGERENNSLAFIRQHLAHGIVDVVTSLLGLAVPINSAILILAATVFFEGAGEEAEGHASPAGLFDAHDLIQTHVGKAAAFVFALALVCAGQTSSITATLAGQIVSEGFIEWRVSPFLRRLITRLMSLVPSVVVAVAIGREGINTLLIASQVALSVVLPFIALPLIYLTSSEVVMRVRKPVRQLVEADGDGTSIHHAEEEVPHAGNTPLAEKVETSSVVIHETIDFSNGRVLSSLAYAIWAVVMIANVYAIVMLGRKD